MEVPNTVNPRSSYDVTSKASFLTLYREQQTFLRTEATDRQELIQSERDDRQETLQHMILQLAKDRSTDSPRAHYTSGALLIPPLNLTTTEGHRSPTVSPRCLDVSPRAYSDGVSPRILEAYHHEDRPLSTPFVRRVERPRLRVVKTPADLELEERDDRALFEAREVERRVILEEQIRIAFQLVLYDLLDPPPPQPEAATVATTDGSVAETPKSDMVKKPKSLTAVLKDKRVVLAEEGKGLPETPLENLADVPPFSIPMSKYFEMMERKDIRIYHAMGKKKGILAHFKTTMNYGIDIPSLKERLNLYGKNQLPPAEEVTFLGLVWEKLNDQMMIILMIAAVVSLVLGLTVPDPHTGKVDYDTGWIEGGAILLSVAVVSLVGAVNDYQKAKQFAALNAANEKKEVRVTRSGDIVRFDVCELVVGDILHVEGGDILSCDAILLEGNEIKIDESASTGESDSVEKGEKDPFLISGTLVMEGRGVCVVVAVGANSFAGKLTMSAREETRETPLQSQLGTMADQIGKLGTWAAVFTFVSLSLKELFFWYFYDRKFSVQAYLEFAIVAITIVVVAIPEGLPLAVTLALAYSMKNMMKDNCLVRVLAACETMGGATTICSDKTGTLTTNKMTVVQGWLAERSFVVPGTGIPQPGYQIGAAEFKIPDVSHSVVQLLIEALSLNSTAEEVKVGNDAEFQGNKTELGLLTFVKHKLNGDVGGIRRANPRNQIYPFSSEKKRMSSICLQTRSDGQKEMIMYSKGAPEILLESCTRVLTPEGKEVALTANKKNFLLSVIAEMALHGNRTIMVAYTKLASAASFPAQEPLNQDLCCISILGIQDPIRPGVPQAVLKCQGAGITVRMVTGDNKQTATSIAKKCGIYREGEGVVLEGREFRQLKETKLDELKALLPRLQVLARSSPTDKYDLVNLLLEQGEVVAVTGDGTNDAPALKLADVGFAMRSGTEIARNAADMILLDDNFVSVVKAAMWGRNVNDCIKKFLQFQITVNVVGVLLTFIGACASASNHSPLSPVQLLWLNLIMDTLAALALATEQPSEEVLDRAPFGKDTPLISTRMWVNIAFGGFFQLIIMLWLLHYGHEYIGVEEGSPVHSTIVFNTFICMQIVNEFNARKLYSEVNVFKGMEKSIGHIYVFVVMVAVQFAAVQWAGKFMGTVPLDWDQWCFCSSIAVGTLPLGFLCRLIPIKTIDKVRLDKSKENAQQVKLKAEWKKTMNATVMTKALALGSESFHWDGKDKEKEKEKEKPEAKDEGSPAKPDASLGNLRKRGSSIYITKPVS